jgi:hypothetical protein
MGISGVANSGYSAQDLARQFKTAASNAQGNQKTVASAAPASTVLPTATTVAPATNSVAGTTAAASTTSATDSSDNNAAAEQALHALIHDLFSVLRTQGSGTGTNGVQNASQATSAVTATSAGNTAAEQTQNTISMSPGALAYLISDLNKLMSASASAAPQAAQTASAPMASAIPPAPASAGSHINTYS